MKNFFSAIAVSTVLLSCGGANDGDPATDTSTTIPPDPAIMNENINDTAANINTNTGTYPTDSGTIKKNDVRSSSSAYPDGRSGKNIKDSSRE